MSKLENVLKRMRWKARQFLGKPEENPKNRMEINHENVRRAWMT